MIMQCNDYYPVIYLKPEKDTPFGRSLPAYAIIGSAPRERSSNVQERLTVKVEQVGELWLAEHLQGRHGNPLARITLALR